MRWYADTPARRARQVAADIVVLLWVVAWVLLGRWVHGVVTLLAAPADPLRHAGSSLQDRMNDVAGTISGLPLVGEELIRPFTGASDVGTDLVSAADRLDSAVRDVALVLSLVTAAVPILLVLGVHLLVRYQWSRSASATGRDSSSAEAVELFALRALVRQPPARLRRVAPDPVAAWRAGDPDVTRELAALELRKLGIRPPAAS